MKKALISRIYPGDESINFVVPPRFIDDSHHQPQQESSKACSACSSTPILSIQGSLLVKKLGLLFLFIAFIVIVYIIIYIYNSDVKFLVVYFYSMLSLYFFLRGTTVSVIPNGCSNFKIVVSCGSIRLFSSLAMKVCFTPLIASNSACVRPFSLRASNI